MQPIKRDQKIPLLPVLIGIVILIPFILATGCTEQAVSNSLLNNTDWTLQSYVFNGVPTQVLTTTKVTLDFDDDGKISGSAGCNHYFASSAQKGSSITIGSAGSTMMYCGEPGVMDQEQAYLSLLSQVNTLILVGDTLTFSDAKGTQILTFTKTIPPVPEPFVGTNWTLESIHTKDAVSSIISGTTITAVFDGEGRVSGSAGCNSYFSQYTVTGTSLAIDPAGSTLMFCDAPGVMQQESTFLAQLRESAGFSLRGDRMILVNTSGITTLSFIKSAIQS